MDDELLEMLDTGRSADRVGARRRERNLRGQVEEDATLAGTLLDLFEQGLVVTVRTTSGRSVVGRLAGVGPDWLAIAADPAAETFVALAAVATVRPAPGERVTVATGEREVPGPRLVHVLARRAAGRPLVRLLAGDETVAGRLLAVGDDVVSVRLDGDARSACYVSAGSISLATVFRSG